MKNADMPAMPIVDPDEGYPLDISKYCAGISTGRFATGLTKREMMAMHALQGLLAAPDLSTVEPRAVAVTAIAYSDALLAELDLTKGESK